MQKGMTPKRGALWKVPNDPKTRNLNTGSQFPRRPLLGSLPQPARAKSCGNCKREHGFLMYRTSSSYFMKLLIDYEREPSAVGSVPLLDRRGQLTLVLGYGLKCWEEILERGARHAPYHDRDD